MLRRREQLAGSYRARVIICASTVIRARARAREERACVIGRSILSVCTVCEVTRRSMGMFGVWCAVVKLPGYYEVVYG